MSKSKSSGIDLELVHQAALDAARPVSCLKWLPGKEDILEFIAAVPFTPRPHPESSPNTWRAELWKWDVAEFFLGKPDGSYLEFNGNPLGAWWFGHFESQGKAMPGTPSLKPSEIKTIVKERSWAVYFQIKDLGHQWSPYESTKGWKVNLCAIRSEGERRELFALKPMDSSATKQKINFHDSSRWLDFPSIDSQVQTLHHQGWI